MENGGDWIEESSGERVARLPAKEVWRADAQPDSRISSMVLLNLAPIGPERMD